MKNVYIFFISLIVLILFSGCSNTNNISSTEVPKETENYEIPMIVDTNQFYHLSSNELKDILGEPTKIDEKKAKIGDFYLFRDSFERYDRQIYCYENDDKSEYQFLIINNKAYSFIYWSPKHADKTANDIAFVKDTDIFKMFNVTPTETANQLRTSNEAMDYELVSDKIWRFDVSFIDRKASTFQLVVITYDVKNMSEEVAAQASVIDESRTVYVTPTGKRYHFDPDCGGKNSTASTLNRAVSIGLKPCEKCAN